MDRPQICRPGAISRLIPDYGQLGAVGSGALPFRVGQCRGRFPLYVTELEPVGWIEPETRVQPHKCSGFRTAGSGGSYASINDQQLAKVI
jgi:hypothetical protein